MAIQEPIEGYEMESMVCWYCGKTTENPKVDYVPIDIGYVEGFYICEHCGAYN